MGPDDGPGIRADGADSRAHDGPDACTDGADSRVCARAMASTFWSDQSIRFR